MLIATAVFVLLECLIAVVAPARFIYLSLWVQTMPYTWNFNTQLVFETPVGPLNVVAMQLFGFCLACVLAMASQFHNAVGQTRYARWHVVFLTFCLISVVYASSAAYGLRMIAKLTAPFLFMIAVLTVIKSQTELQKMRTAILGSGVILLSLALLARAAGIGADPNASETGLSGLGPPGMGPPVFSAHMLSVAMLSLAMYLCRPRISSLGFVIMSAISVMAALQRTSAAALYLGFSVILFFGTRGIWRVLLPSLGLVGFPALLVLSATFRRRMFFGEADTDKLLADPAAALASVNGSGRFDLWDIMLRTFFEPHPFFGSGAGSTQEYLYSHLGAPVVHSEYVRLLCEVGIVGLVLFVMTLVAYLGRLVGFTAKSNDEHLRVSALAAIGSVIAYAVFCSTDNAFDYVSEFGIYVFGLVAVAIKSMELSRAIDREAWNKFVAPAPLFPNLMN